MYKLGDRVQLGKNWKSKNLDVEIDSAALREKIISLSETELRRGEGNLILWLRNQFGTLSEPLLEREDGFKGVRQFPKIVGDTGSRKTKLTKLEYLLTLDNRAPPNPLLYPICYFQNPNSSTNLNTHLKQKR